MNDTTATSAVVEDVADTMIHYQDSQARFLAAWKQAVQIIGPQLFACGNSDNCATASERELLRPDSQAIEHYLSRCSIGQGVFIGAVVSFFNSDWGADICNGFGYSGLGDIAHRLELNELKIITELMLSHTGW